MNEGKKNALAATVGVIGGPGAAITVKWLWDSMMPGNPMPHEVALFLAGVISTVAGTFLPQAFGGRE